MGACEISCTIWWFTYCAAFQTKISTLSLLDRASLDSWIKIEQLDVTCFIISLFTAQHVSNVSTSIFRSLRLIVDLFHVLYCSGSMCVGVTVRFFWVVWYPYALDQLDVTCFIISLFTAQHASNVSTSIFRSLRLIVDLSHGLYCSAIQPMR